jgi:hypothetical protein
MPVTISCGCPQNSLLSKEIPRLCRGIVTLNDMATLTKTLKLPFLRLNQAKAEEFARLEALPTSVANAILALPKDARRELTSKFFAHVETCPRESGEPAPMKTGERRIVTYLRFREGRH